MTQEKKQYTSAFPQLGEVYWIKNPAKSERTDNSDNCKSDLDQSVAAVIVSTNGRNKCCNDVSIVPVISSTGFSVHPLVHVEMPAGEGGLKTASVARCDQMTVIDKSFLAGGPLGGIIDSSYRERIIIAVRRAIGDTNI